MDVLLQQIINGLVLGSMYALVALGYTMVYGIIGLINFAHGDVLMVGALTSWTIIGWMSNASPGLPGWMVLLHLTEIYVWAGFYLWRDAFSDLGTAFYFSAVTYTTTGYGDLVLPDVAVMPLASVATAVKASEPAAGGVYVVVYGALVSVLTSVPPA